GARLHPRDPRVHVRADGGRALALHARPLDVEHDGQIARAETADRVHHDVGHAVRVVGGAEELVRAADHAGGLDAGPVAHELVVAAVAVADAGDRVLPAGAVHGVPVDGAL